MSSRYRDERHGCGEPLQCLAFMLNSTELEQILFRLGDSADIVAATLHSRGIKGMPNTDRNLNPIVRFTQIQLDLDDVYSLDLLHAGNLEACAIRILLPSGDQQVAPLPRPLRQFLDAFNAGCYPELELPSPK